MSCGEPVQRRSVRVASTSDATSRVPVRARNSGYAQVQDADERVSASGGPSAIR
jgi:hypothetical protein